MGWSFYHEADENCYVLGYYAASSDDSLPMFRDNQSVPSSRVKNSIFTFEDGTDRLSRNIGKESPLLAAK